MAKESLGKKLEALRINFGVNELQEMSSDDAKVYDALAKDNQELPVGIVKRGEYSNYYWVEDCALNRDELNEYLQYLMIKKTNTIKNCVVFTTSLLILSIVSGIIMYFQLLS